MNTQSFTKRSFSVLATIILLLVVLPVTTVLAATAGPNYAGTGTNDPGTGTAAWANPEYISADDTSYATANLSLANVTNSQYLLGTNYGFAIPSAATIEGIQVTIGRYASGMGPGVDVRDNVVKLIKNGNMTGDNKADTGTDWSEDPLSSVTYGSSSDLWGISWTPADINAANFGVALAADSDVNRTAYVDYMQITVTYTIHTTTTVNCGAGNPVVQYGSTITCVATVSRAAGADTPSGSVNWDTNDNGSFGASTCDQNTALGTFTCTTVYTPGAVGDGSHNITATYAGDANFTGSSGNRDVTVNTIALIPGITASSKTYDGSNTATIATRSLTGILDSDDVSLSGGVATFDEKNVGNGKTVTGSAFTLTGAQAGNYHLSPTTATTTANISPATLAVIGVTAENKVYDGNAVASLSGTAVLSGTIFVDDDVSLGGTPSASFADKNIGTDKPVIVTGYALSGLDIGNYTLSQPSGLSADITVKALKITAEDKEKLVGEADPDFTYLTDGLVGSDVFVTPPACGVAGDHEAKGTYDIVCDGADAGTNYAISYESGTLTVSDPVPVVLSVTRTDPSPTTASIVNFTVTFSEAVTGVDTSAPFNDFALTTTGVISGATVIAVADTGDHISYAVTVDTGLGNGTIRLDVADDNTIMDMTGNPLGGDILGDGNFTTGEEYTVYQLVTRTFKSTGTRDGWILESLESSNKGGSFNSTATTFYVGDNEEDKQYRSVLSFITKGLPDDAVITKVTLKVRKQGVVGGGNPVTAFQGFIADIKRGFFGPTAGLQVGDFQARPHRNYGPFKPTVVRGWYTINLTSARGYINKTGMSGGLTQIRLRFKRDDNDNAAANYLKLFSGNAALAYRPQLIIEYYVP